MQEKISVVLADADENFRTMLYRALEKDGDFWVCACVGDGKSAVEAVRRTRPAVLVTELGLPWLDGFGVMDRLREEGICVQTIVLTAQMKRQLVERACRKGAYYFMPKPCDLGSLKECIREAAVEGKRRSGEPSVNEQWILLAALNRLGLPPGDEGSRVAEQCVLLVAKDPALLRNMNGLYTAVLRGEKDSPAAVERALRYAVERAWKEGDRQFQAAVFGASVRANTGRPTNKNFIAALANYVRLAAQYDAQCPAGELPFLDERKNG